jgi:HD-like signal output (HDOD) protein
MNKQNKLTSSIALEFLQSGISLPFSSSIGSQVLHLVQSPLEKIDIAALVKLIQMDPGFTTKILQLANSAYIGSLNKITSLRQAVVHIGLEETINIISVLLCRDALPKFPSLDGEFSDKDFWLHSWACAMSNKMLGHPESGSSVLPGELYIAGLLHGIGKLILAIQQPDKFVQCLRNSKDFSQPLAEAEQDVIGTTSADIAAEVLKAWQLSENVCMAVRYYQDPGKATQQYREIAGLTQFAYFIANTSGVGNMGDEFSFDLRETWISRESGLPLSDESVQGNIVGRIYKVLQTKSSALGSLDKDSSDEKEEDAPALSERHWVETGASKGKQKRGFLAWLRSLFS